MEQRGEFKEERSLYNGSETSQAHLVEKVDYLEKSEPSKNWKGFWEAVMTAACCSDTQQTEFCP